MLRLRMHTYSMPGPGACTHAAHAVHAARAAQGYCESSQGPDGHQAACGLAAKLLATGTDSCQRLHGQQRPASLLLLSSLPGVRWRDGHNIMITCSSIIQVLQAVNNGLKHHVSGELVPGLL